MTIRFRDRMARGHVRRGWLESRHSFSFGDYRDPDHRGFRSLRVINEDWVVPGAGFAEHGHEDMEIITYVLDGALRHADSTGAGSIVRPGEIQRMSAGTGVRHSETNASATDTLHLLQIWIVPDRVGIAPDYEQKNFPADRQRNQPILVASPDGRDGSVTVRQDAKLFLGRLDDGCGIVHPLAAGRGAWLQVARGLIGLNGTEMREGDGAAVEGEPFLTIEADTDAEILLFDLA